MLRHITRFYRHYLHMFPYKGLSHKTTFQTYSLSLLIIFLGVFMLNNKSVATQPLYAPPFEIEKIGRGFDKISIHPNGEDWIFSECVENNSNQSECHILKFNLHTKQLYRYVTPAGYQYSFPSFSPKG